MIHSYLTCVNQVNFPHQVVQLNLSLNLICALSEVLVSVSTTWFWDSTNQWII